MAKALNEMWPETWHGLCTWHIMQNGIKHLGNLMKGGSHFLQDLKKCIFEYEKIQFEDAWLKLLSDYGVDNNSWLNHIYELKYKWARCYMKNTFTLGMRSTQLSESLNSDMKDYLKSTLDIVQFFKHFERVVNDKRANELKAEFDSRNKLPRNLFPMSPIIKQAGETFGILCCHALKVLDGLDIKFIPATYILRRWIRAARSMVVVDNEDKQLDSINASDGSKVVASDEVPNVMSVIGLKKKEKCKGGKRMKGWREKAGKKKRNKETTNTKEKRSKETTSTEDSQGNHLVPAPTSGAFTMSDGPNYSQQMDENISFTSLLTENFDHDLSLALSSQASTRHVHYF
ncbi:protein FAR-RED IMPAIRED RESPONSE 1-like [Telopea speciosissima]|uniref:protein FAR-RED IMPAIRED RESPONSE 1-like n=1 Tax=Telopea speciosissima TaxID=54955 RepID=UPI001CC5C9A0|nr:protein FAR-RED IMPAIRED RESPONSE 1-like [Telopea speciosissima]